MAVFVEPAPAKLNLALHVRGRRVDGYHELETVFAFVADGDVLTVSDAQAPSFAIRGPFAAGLDTGPDNLVLRALSAFGERFGGVGALAITLDKRLPIASGIGGGSADAAAMLRVLARRQGIAIDDPALAAVALAIGSDVPACLHGRTALGKGRGERLVPLSGGAGMPVLLVNPGVEVSTRAVFAGWDGVDRGSMPVGDLLDMVNKARNDLEAPARGIAPAIDDVLARLSGLGRLARMSGSGATCFALFDTAVERAVAARTIRNDRPDWWCLETALT